MFLYTDFTTIEYLKTGNKKQQLAHATLTQNGILTKLANFDPILVGTIPIAIDIHSSDLDIICYCPDLTLFSQIVVDAFGTLLGFQLKESRINDYDVVISNFVIAPFEIEIFGQAIPSKQQNAYRHMLIEHTLLWKHGESFRQQIIDLKKQGYKTEPAFGIALGLEGDPYEALLRYKL